MKKPLTLIVFIFIIIGNVFSVNPANDFKYKLSNDGKYVIITGFRNQRSDYIFPETIEEFPVREVKITNVESGEIFGNVKQVSLKLNSNITNFIFEEYHHWNKSKCIPIVIEGLSDNIIECNIKSFPSPHGPTFYEDEADSPNFKTIKIKGSLEVLKNAKTLIFTNVIFEKTSLIVQKGWDNYSFWCTNLEEVIFEDGILKTSSFAFSYNSKLRKIIFPSTIKSIGVSNFCYCPKLSELIIPDEITNLQFEKKYTQNTFAYTDLQLKTQAKLKQLGYNGDFFAKNQSSDLDYMLSANGEYVIITGFKNKKAKYIIPENIEGFPVTKVAVSGTNAFSLFGDVKQVSIILSKSLTCFELWIYDVLIDITLEGLSDGIKEFYVFSDDRMKFASMSDPPSDKFKPIKIKDSMEFLSNAKTVVCRNVKFEKTSLIIKRTWEKFVFSNTNLEDISFEDGIKMIGQEVRSVDGFSHNKNLQKVSFPPSVTDIADGTFNNCPRLSELIIPDEILFLNFHKGYYIFKNTALPLKIQAKLKQLGYSGAF